MAGLAWIALEQGDYEIAEAGLEKTLSINPFLIDVQRQFTVLKNRKGKQSIKFQLNTRAKCERVELL